MLLLLISYFSCWSGYRTVYSPGIIQAKKMFSFGFQTVENREEVFDYMNYFANLNRKGLIKLTFLSWRHINWIIRWVSWKVVCGEDSWLTKIENGKMNILLDHIAHLFEFSSFKLQYKQNYLFRLLTNISKIESKLCVYRDCRSFTDLKALEKLCLFSHN